MKTFAPIALFVYNRPAHTRRVVEALLKNEEAGSSDLFIFSDAPKNEEANESVRHVRDYIKTVSGFKSITINEQTQNQGLAKSIINGVTEVVNTYGNIIVLEDDIETSPYFLKFMNDALNLYEKEKRVWSVSGYSWDIPKDGLSETFFTKFPACWGWATWSDRWSFFERDTDKLLELFTPNMKKVFNVGKSNYFFQQIELNKSGAINTWYIYWNATVFLNGGLCLYPRDSLVRNVGSDGTGVHGENTDCHNTSLNNSYRVAEFESIILENNLARKRLAKVFSSFKSPNRLSILRHLLSRVKKEGLAGSFNYYIGTPKTTKKILALIRDNNYILISEITKILNISRFTAQRHIKKLVANGSIERVGANNGDYWRII